MDQPDALTLFPSLSFGFKFQYIWNYNPFLLIQVTTASMKEHTNNLLKIPGSKVLFGGEPLENHSIPEVYGAFKPTAVFVPLVEILKSDNFELVTKEIFGPFQVIHFQMLTLIYVMVKYDFYCNWFSYTASVLTY
jgi:hypothetical protein